MVVIDSDSFHRYTLYFFIDTEIAAKIGLAGLQLTYYKQASEQLQVLQLEILLLFEKKYIK